MKFFPGRNVLRVEIDYEPAEGGLKSCIIFDVQGMIVFQAYAYEQPKAVIFHQGLAWFLAITGLSTDKMLGELVKSIEAQSKIIKQQKELIDGMS